MSWAPGDVVVYRHRSYDGRFLSGLPLTVIEATGDLVVGYLPSGTLISRPAAADGSDLRTIPLAERWAAPRIAKLSPFTLNGPGDGTGRLIILFPLGRAHAIWIFRAPDRLHGWYVNLEDPQVLADRTITSRDHVLDLWVPAESGVPRWKDEDELAAAVANGIRTEEEAVAFRAEGERVIREQPWPTGWEDVEPDPAWPLPELFDGWDVA